MLHAVGCQLVLFSTLPPNCISTVEMPAGSLVCPSTQSVVSVGSDDRLHSVCSSVLGRNAAAACKLLKAPCLCRLVVLCCCYRFNACSLEGEEQFMLMGLVLGLAIYNRVLLDFPLPLPLYKKLLSQPVGLRDLEEMQPMLGRSLRQLLHYDGASSVEVSGVGAVVDIAAEYSNIHNNSIERGLCA